MRRERDDVRRLVEGADLVGLMTADGIEVRRCGSTFVAVCPWHQERTGSCYLYEDGHYHCFGCGAHGDAVTYLREKRGMDFEAALQHLGAQPPVPQEHRPLRSDKRNKWLPVTPAPAILKPRPGNLRHFRDGEPSVVWPYLDRTGQVLAADARYDLEGGGKNVRSWSVRRHVETGAVEWRCKALPDPHPLFGLEQLDSCAEVLICEGCKAATAAKAIWPERACMSWRGGWESTRPGKHDCTPLAGRRVFIWPDADWDDFECCQEWHAIPPGQAPEDARCPKCGSDPGEIRNKGLIAARRMARNALAAGAAAVSICTVDEYRHIKDGWDLADARA